MIGIRINALFFSDFINNFKQSILWFCQLFLSLKFICSYRDVWNILFHSHLIFLLRDFNFCLRSFNLVNFCGFICILFDLWFLNLKNLLWWYSDDLLGDTSHRFCIVNFDFFYRILSTKSIVSSNLTMVLNA